MGDAGHGHDAFKASSQVGWRHKAAPLGFEPAGHVQAEWVGKTAADDLCADRQAVRTLADRDGGGTQAHHAGVARPEQAVGVRLILAVDLQHAIPTLALLVVKKGGRCGDRCDEQVHRLEVVLPLRPQYGALLVKLDPVAVRERAAAPHALAHRVERRVALVGQILRAGKSRAVEPSACGRSQQVRIHAVRLRAVHRAVIVQYGHALGSQKVGQRVQSVLNALVHPRFGVVEDDGHAAFPQRLVVAAPLCRCPAQRVKLLQRCDQHLHGQLQVLSAARQRHGHGNVHASMQRTPGSWWPCTGTTPQVGLCPYTPQ